MDDYFDLYELPRSFTPDVADVKKKYLLYSRLYHPDRFATATPSESREALKQSAVNNAAYRTLTDPDKTMAYMLKLHGVVEEEEKYALPPDFLMEMMDLNEAVEGFEESGNAADKEAVFESLRVYESGWEAGLRPLFEQYEAGDAGEALLLRIKDFYFRKKYLDRIKSKL